MEDTRQQMIRRLIQRMTNAIAEENRRHNPPAKYLQEKQAVKNSEPIQNNSNTTLEPLTRWMENYLKTDTPERIADSKRLMERTSQIIIKELAEENLRMFGTTIPKHLKTNDEAAFEFDEAYYNARWKPLFGKFAKIFESEVAPGDYQELINRILGYMKERGFTREGIEKANPYFVRYLNDAYDAANNL